jgi:hypothetical protein
MKTTLTKVIRMAFRDEAFLNALIKNPGRALGARKLELSTSSREKLKSALRANVTMKGSELLAMLASSYAKGSPPPPPWPIEVLSKMEMKSPRKK